MGRFLIRKAAHLIVALVLVGAFVAFLIDLTPGDPAFSILGEQASPDQVRQLHADLHLDDPFLARYWRWLSGIVSGDFGTSYQTGRSVSSMIVERLPVTAELVTLTLVIALVVAIPVGVLTAYKADTALDRIWSTVSSAIISVPAFVSGLLLVYLFAVRLGSLPVRLPATGWTPLSDSVGDNLWHIVLPTLTLALGQIPTLSLVLRADMIASLDEDYILAARSRGIPTRRILMRHALRPSSFSLVTVAGLSLGSLISGAVVVEVLFGLPGLGQLIVNSIFNRDVVVVQGVVMFIAIFYVVINAAIDALYVTLDPRVRLERAR